MGQSVVSRADPHQQPHVMRGQVKAMLVWQKKTRSSFRAVQPRPRQLSGDVWLRMASSLSCDGKSTALRKVSHCCRSRRAEGPGMPQADVISCGVTQRVGAKDWIQGKRLQPPAVLLRCKKPWQTLHLQQHGGKIHRAETSNSLPSRITLGPSAPPAPEDHCPPLVQSSQN